MVAEKVNANRLDENGFSGAIATREASIEVASTRAAQEVQAAMAIAKRFPRDETASYQRIMQACKRKGLAEASLYAYPKGGQTVTGPSIRLAEMLAQNWGNCDFGVIELEQRKGESTVMSYAWDLETNTRQTKIFNIKHERHTKQGVKSLADPRDIYELTANQGARRLRACILGIIPGDVVDAAVAECEKTMGGNNAEPLVDRIRAMVTAFAELSVTQDMLEKRLQHKVEATTEAELVNLKKIYRSLRDNMADRSDFFEVGNAAAGGDMDAKLAEAARKKREAAEESQTPPEENPTRDLDGKGPEAGELQEPGADSSHSESAPAQEVAAERIPTPFEQFKTQCVEACKVRGQSPMAFAQGWARLLKEKGLRSTTETKLKDWAEIIEAATKGQKWFA